MVQLTKLTLTPSGRSDETTRLDASVHRVENDIQQSQSNQHLEQMQPPLSDNSRHDFYSIVSSSDDLKRTRDKNTVHSSRLAEATMLQTLRKTFSLALGRGKGVEARDMRQSGKHRVKRNLPTDGLVLVTEKILPPVDEASESQ